jgi:cell division protein FtsW
MKDIFIKVFKGFDLVQLFILIIFSLLSIVYSYSFTIDSELYPLVRKLFFILYFWVIIIFVNKILFEFTEFISPVFFVITIPIILLAIFSPFFFTTPTTLSFAMFRFELVPMIMLAVIMYLPKKISIIIEKKGTTFDFIKSVGAPLIFMIILLALIDFGYAISLILIFLIIFWVYFRITYLLKFVSLLIVILAALSAFIYVVDTPRTNIIKERIEKFVLIDEIPSDALNVLNSEVTEKIKEGGVFGVGPRNINPYNNQTAFIDIIYQYGILVGIAIMFLYLVLVYNGIRNIYNGTNLYSVILQITIIVYFSILAFIHIFISIGFFPFYNIDLPFISSNGSNLLIDGILVGILLKKNYKDINS